MYVQVVSQQSHADPPGFICSCSADPIVCTPSDDIVSLLYGLQEQDEAYLNLLLVQSQKAFPLQQKYQAFLQSYYQSYQPYVRAGTGVKSIKSMACRWLMHPMHH